MIRGKMTRQGARDSLRYMGQERDHKSKTSSGRVNLNEFIFKEKKSNNFLRWEKYWKLTRSLEYGTELKIMIQNMIDGEFPLFERLEAYPELMEIKPYYTSGNNQSYARGTRYVPTREYKG